MHIKTMFEEHKLLNDKDTWYENIKGSIISNIWPETLKSAIDELNNIMDTTMNLVKISVLLFITT